jgi:hypothetical protein
VKFENFTEEIVMNVRPYVVAELPPPEKQTMSPLWRETVPHRRHRCPPVPGMRLDRIRSRPNQTTSKNSGHEFMKGLDGSEIKDWLREIRIEKIERTLKPVKKKTKMNLIIKDYK